MRALTVKERIQLHLFDFNRFAESYEAPRDLTQEAIARVVGIRVHHVNQYVTPLKDDGLVEERLSHVRQSPRRRKTYVLTAKGRTQAASLRAELLGEEVPFRDRDGRVQPVPLSRILLEDRRGSRLVQLLTELQAVGYLTEAPTDAKAGFVDFTQDAPSVDRFYGRQEELAAIVRSLETSHTVVATGITGIGKSTLGAKVCEALRGHRSLLWRTIRPWDTVTDLAGRLGGFLRSHGRIELGGLLMGPGPKDLARIEDIVVRDLKGLPAVLVFDDAQNASADVQAFLRVMVRAIGPANGPAMLLLSRIVPDFYTRRDVAIDGAVVEVALSGLDRKSSARLLADSGLGDPVAGSLSAACGGVPLFLKLLASAGPKAATSAGWRTLETYIAEQVEPTLDAAERSALEIAAFYDIAVPASGLLLAEDIRRRTLIALQRKGLLSPADTDLLTVHEAIRAFVRDGLSADRRETLVAKIVPWLVEGSRSALERGDAREAISYLANAVAIDAAPLRRTTNLERLGDLRRLVGDVPGAADAYRTALKDVTGGSERAILRRKTALCLEKMGHLDEAVAEIEAGWKEIPREPSLAAGWLSFQAASLAFTRQDYDTGLREVERVASWMTGFQQDSELWGLVTNLRGLIYLYDPRRKDPALARADFLAASQALSAANDRRGLCLVYNNLFLAATELGDAANALPDLDRSASLARQIGDVPALETALFTKAWFLTEHLGDYEAAETLYNETYRLAKETHQREKVVWHYYHFATLYQRTGRYQEAKESMAYFLESSGFLSNPERRVQDLSEMSRICLLAGDVPAAEAYLAQAEALCSAASSDVMRSPTLRARAALCAHRGDAEGAKTCFERALAACPLESRGELLLEYGRFLGSSKEATTAKEILLEARGEFTRSQPALVLQADAALRSIGA